MKIFVLKPNESWICDRLAWEYQKYSKHNVSLRDFENADIIWLLAPWCWRHLPLDMLKKRFVVCTIHHEVPEKFNEARKNEFIMRDQFVDYYHVFNEKTKAFIKQRTQKSIIKLDYWVNTDLWRELPLKDARKELELPKDKFIVSSFQRDTEGSDLKTPKLEKGPDRFCDYVEKLNKWRDNVHVLLGGWRRQYVIKRLNEAKISFTYIEFPALNVVNKMYAATDLYVVSARTEGGPQAVLECAITKTPIVSSDVGIAKDILHANCIIDFDNLNLNLPTKSEIALAYEKAKNLEISKQIKVYDDFFEMIT